MPSQNPSMNALDSLRTVEFRQTLRGYHIDDVDEYLERVAVEAEALQEQLRQSAERMRQATDRIAQLEQSPRPAPAPAAAQEVSVGDDSLQRTLLLAQRFVEQTEAEARAQAQTVVDEAEERARVLVTEAEEKAKSIGEDSERQLREEVTRLEGLRTKLAGDVETISRHLDAERARLRGALGEMVRWIDETLQPSTGKAPAGPSGDGRARPEMGAGTSGTRSGLQTVSPANTPNGTPR